MRQITKSILILCTFLIPYMDAQCDHWLFLSRGELTCNTVQDLGIAHPNYPPHFSLGGGVTKMNFDIIFKVNGMCSQTAGDVIPLVSCFDDLSGSPFGLLKFFWDGPNSIYKVQTGDALGGPDQDLYTLAIHANIQDDLWVEFLGGFDFPSNKVSATVMIDPLVDYQPSPGNLNSGSLTSLGPNTFFRICADDSGTTVISCLVESFVIWFNIFSPGTQAFYFMWGVTPILHRSYSFKERMGMIAQDDHGSSGTATFGPSPSDSPKWLIKESGIEFTSMNQYVKIPTFFFFSSIQSIVEVSLTINFWIRLPTPSFGSIFQYSSSDFSTSKVSVGLNLDGSISGFLANSEITRTNNLLSLSNWNLITFTFITTVEGLHFASCAVNGVIDNSIVLDSQPQIIDDPSDNVHIGGPGGFLGQIARFEIYNPGSLRFESSCSPFTCMLQLGVAATPLCLKYQGCHETCQTCFDESPDSCSTCNTPGYLYPINTCASCDLPMVPQHDALTGIDYCLPPCSDIELYYHADLQQCEVSCLDSYTEDTSTFYKSCKLPETNITTTFLETSKEVIGSSTTATVVAIQLANVLSRGSPMGIATAIGSKIFSDIKYLDISYSYELEEILKSTSSSFISIETQPDLPEGIVEQIEEKPVPWRFAEDEVSSSFLINIWEELFVILCVIGVLVVVSLCELLIKQIKTKAKSLLNNIAKIIRTTIQNFLWTQLYSVYGDVVLFSALEYRTSSTGISGISFGASLIFLIVMISGFLIHLKLLFKYQKLKKETEASKNKEKLDEWIQDHKGNALFFKDVKDDSLQTQLFLVLLTLRDLLFSLTLALLFEHPIVQNCLILLYNIAMIVYLLVFNPLEELLDRGQQLFYEALILSVNIMTFIMAIMDSAGTKGEGARNNMGKAIVIENMLFNFGTLFVMAMKAIIGTIEAYKVLKEYYQENRTIFKRKKLRSISPEPSDQIERGEEGTSLKHMFSIDEKPMTRKYSNNKKHELSFIPQQNMNDGADESILSR